MTLLGQIGFLSCSNSLMAERSWWGRTPYKSTQGSYLFKSNNTKFAWLYQQNQNSNYCHFLAIIRSYFTSVALFQYSCACVVILCAAELSGGDGGKRQTISPLCLQATCLHFCNYWGLYSSEAGVCLISLTWSLLGVAYSQWAEIYCTLIDNIIFHMLTHTQWNSFHRFFLLFNFQQWFPSET